MDVNRAARMAGAPTRASVTGKVAAILRTFLHGSDLSLTDIARIAGLPESTTHRLAWELVAGGILDHDGRRYRIGAQLLTIATGVSPPPTALERAQQVMEDLADAVTPGYVRLGFLDGHKVAFIESVRRPRRTCCAVEPVRLPIHATAMGRALLAFCPPQTVDRVLADGLRRYTNLTITSPDRLRRALRETRLTGVAITRRELTSHLSAVAVPVLGADASVVAALEVSVRQERDVPMVQPAVIVAARGLSRQLQDARGGGWPTFPAGQRHDGPRGPQPRLERELLTEHPFVQRVPGVEQQPKRLFALRDFDRLDR